MSVTGARPRFVLTRSAVAAAVVVAALASVLVLESPPPALADIKQQIRSAQARLDALNNTAEAAAERYNSARLRLADAQQRAEIATASLGRAQARLDRSKAAISRFAAQTYMTGTLDNITAFAAGSSPTEFLDRMTTLQAIANSQRQTMAELAAASHQHAAAQAAATAAAREQQTVLRAAQAEKARVIQAATQARSVLSELQRKQTELIRAAKAAAARRAAEAQAAALARQQRLAALAAAQFAHQSLTPAASPLPSHISGDPVATAIDVARAQLGKPYVWGAAGPDSFDCSGLTLYAYGKAGIYLPHYTGDQWNEGRHVAESQLRPGDLVFFNTDGPLGHEGMYLGGGEFIHAPHTGDVVKISPLSGYYQQTYAGAVRLVG